MRALTLNGTINDDFENMSFRETQDIDTYFYFIQILKIQSLFIYYMALFNTPLITSVRKAHFSFQVSHCHHTRNNPGVKRVCGFPYQAILCDPTWVSNNLTQLDSVNMEK